MAHGAPSAISYKWSYDVFISFHVEDTHFTFPSHLHQSLIQTGIRVFRNDELIRKGENITSTNFKAMHESRIAIIIFSKNYASSAFCLQELVQILECFKDEGRLIYPVFFDVDPSEVRHQTRSYAEALAQLEQRFIDKRHQVEEWRRALSQAAEIEGYHFQPGPMNAYECIVEIIEQLTTWMYEKEEKEQQEHGDTIHETTDFSFWEKKERIGSYDVFLSYREAQQFDFPKLLCDSLHQEGLSVYHVPISNVVTMYRQIIDKSFKAIHKSRIAIIVFSKNYADSTFRLKELVQILEFFNSKREGWLIYPVFYDVDPSEVQHQTGSYAKALAQKEKSFIDKRDQVEEWRRALSQVGEIKGYHFQPKTINEDECIGAIVGRVTAWMNENVKYWVWEKGEEIGSGAHGIVYEARHWKTGAICGAIKELNIGKANASEYIRKEIKFLSKLKEHPNIVKYYDNKDEGGCISLYMEYIQPGSLKKYISKQGKLTEDIVQNFTAQILFGLVHLHSNRQVHRDIKPDNLLVDSKDSKDIVKLADFGLAKLLEESEGEHSVGGTRLYSAPEVRLGQYYDHSHEAYAADIWSLGCVIVEMSSGLQPQLIDYDSDSNLHPRIPEELCEDGVDFLNGCFKRKPADRPCAKNLLEHPFVKAKADALMEENTRIDGVGTC